MKKKKTYVADRLTSGWNPGLKVFSRSKLIRMMEKKKEEKRRGFRDEWGCLRSVLFAMYYV
jgi:hypothetical protein